MFEESDRVENETGAEEFYRPSPLFELLKKKHGDKRSPWSEPIRQPK